MLLPEFKWQSMIHVAPDCKGQGNFFCMVLMTADSQLIIIDLEGFFDNATPEKKV